MRILTLSYEFPPIGGGGGKVAAGLAREFVRLGHEVDLFTMGFSDLPRQEFVDGIRVIRIGHSRKRIDFCTTREMLPYYVQAIPTIVREVSRRRYDIGHTHFIFPDGVASALIRAFQSIPFVVTTHGSDVPGYNPERFQIQHAILKPVWKYVARSASYIVCPSAHLQGLLLQNKPHCTSGIIPNGIDIGKFRADGEKRPTSILVVTRMFERKGVQYLLRAIHERKINAEINLVGDGPYLATLKAMAKELALPVRFWGWLDNDSAELKQLYESCAIFVFTSIQENFPINLLEAMTAGMAIITSDASGTKEVVGNAGILVPPGDTAKLGEALATLLQDAIRVHNLGEIARRRVVAQFSYSAVARRYLDLLESLSIPQQRLGSEAHWTDRA